MARTHEHQPPSLWLQAFAIGFYGVRPPDEVLPEKSALGSGFMSHLYQTWESAARHAAQPQMRQVVLRLGLVFGRDGDALPKMLAPYRLGLVWFGRSARGWQAGDCNGSKRKCVRFESTVSSAPSSSSQAICRKAITICYLHHAGRLTVGSSEDRPKIQIVSEHHTVVRAGIGHDFRVRRVVRTECRPVCRLDTRIG